MKHLLYYNYRTLTNVIINTCVDPLFHVKITAMEKKGFVLFLLIRISKEQFD